MSLYYDGKNANFPKHTEGMGDWISLGNWVEPVGASGTSNFEVTGTDGTSWTSTTPYIGDWSSMPSITTPTSLPSSPSLPPEPSLTAPYTITTPYTNIPTVPTTWVGTEKPQIKIKPRLVSGDLVYSRFHDGPFVLIQPTSMMLDEDTASGNAVRKYQRVAVEDAWTVQDKKGNTKAIPSALLTKCPPPPKASFIDIETVNMGLLALLSALTSACLSCGIYLAMH